MSALDTHEAKAAAFRACLLESGEFASAEEDVTWDVLWSDLCDMPALRVYGPMTERQWAVAVRAHALIGDEAPTLMYPTGEWCWGCYSAWHWLNALHTCGGAA